MTDRNQDRISAINSPHELALGIAFGVLIGLMPKDSAIPWLLALTFLLGRGNILCVIVSAIAFSIVGPWIDVWSDRMGEAVLSIKSLQTTYASWMDLPWVAWTRFNNTVVTGSLVIGLIAWIPVYLASQIFFRVWGIAMIQRLMQSRPMKFLFGESADQTAADPQQDTPLSVES